MRKLRLVLSFDHELSLGGADSYQRNLFAPTEELFGVAAELGVKIVLFTDVLCAMRFRDWDRDGFFEPYCRQLENALLQGHDVQLHIHPHWLDSTWENGTFKPSTSFALSNFAAASPPFDIRGIVGSAYDFLSHLCSSYDSSYKCIAYRAGGYNFAPATAEILQSLYEKGIRIDSTIIKGYRFKSGISEVDFSGMPAAANWTIPLSGPLHACDERGIFEVPIAGKPRTPLNNVPFLVNRVLHRRRGYDSGGRSIHAGNTSIPDKLARLFPRSAWTLGFDEPAQSRDDVMSVLRSYVESHGRDDEIICATISHPKSMGAYEFDLMRSFVSDAAAEYGGALEFWTYRDVYEKVIVDECINC